MKGLLGFLLMIILIIGNTTAHAEDMSKNLVYFKSEVCSPCQNQLKIINELREYLENQGILITVIDVNKQPEVALSYGFAKDKNVPLIIYKENNEEIFELRGLHFRDQIISKIKKADDKIIFAVGKHFYINNKSQIQMDVPTIICNDRTYVPVRYLANALGISDNHITYNNNRVTLIKGNTVIELIIDRSSIIINGNEITIDTASFIQDSRTYLPARFIAEALGYKVDWINNSVVISTMDRETSFNDVEVASYSIEGKISYKVDDMLTKGGLGEVIYDTENVIILPVDCRYAGIILEDGKNIIYLVDWMNNYARYQLNNNIITNDGKWYVQGEEDAIKVGMLATLVR